MSLLAQIKADQLAARKVKDTRKTALLTTLIGEAVNVGKNDGNRETNDAEVEVLIKKFVKNINDTITAMDDAVNADGSADRYVNLLHEKSILEAYLPKQLTEAELSVIINSIITAGANNIGEVTKQLRTTYPNQYDGKIASRLIKEQLA